MAALFSASLLAGIGAGPASGDVSAVSGSAFGYYVNFGLFGGPPSVRGYGQTIPPGSDGSASPSVMLPAGGGDQTAADPDGAVAIYGPARIFESHGTMTVSTHGTTGAAGSSTSFADVRDIQPNDPFTASAPGGVASTCTVTEAALTGSTTITNGRLVLADPNQDVSGEPGENIVTPPVNPAPNTEYRGVLGGIGETFRIVFNEQVLTPDAITVNAVHVYMTNDSANPNHQNLGIGEMIIAQSHCDVTATTANAAPVAANDAYSAEKGTTLTVAAPGVLANDTDPEGGPLTASQVTPIPFPAGGGGDWTFPGDPTHGTLTLNSDGSFTYAPYPGYTGPDSFRYQAQDQRGNSATATVTIQVNPPAVNTPPVARDDAYTANWQDAALNVGPPGVLANDTDVNTDALTAVSASTPAHGTLTLNPNGSFTYTPVAGYGGTDTFTYRANDGIDSSAPATVTITVIPKPVQSNDNFANAQVISGPSGSVTGSDAGATSEPGEPSHPGGDGES
ncbi:MAG: cadherin-like domain-containing protein, partial [Actinobacteria bacterium]|nr:cadherin-like domain-containing protein [Actinomycetota bacterium]